MQVGAVSGQTVPKVSIITISKDDPEGLSVTIASALLQRFQSFELIVVRSGTSQLLTVPAERRIRVIDQPSRGISAAFNCGIDQASGEWVQFLNGGDVYLDEGALGRLVAAASSDVRMVLSFARVANRPFTIPRRALCHGADSFYYASHQASLFDRRLFERFGAFEPDVKVRMDLDWLTRLPRATPYAFVCSETVRFDASGVSGSDVVRSSLEEARILWRVPSLRLHALGAILLFLPFRVLRREWRRIAA